MMDPSTVTRGIIDRTRGESHGGMTRLMSPGVWGHRLKPFVFLDLAETDASRFNDMPLHPHSGLATVTILTEGNLRFDSPECGTGFLTYGGVEWNMTGNGVWHGRELIQGTSERVRGFQLWLALSPELENAAPYDQYVEAHHIPSSGPARLILGEYDGLRSPVNSPPGVNYLVANLRFGERWEYQPPLGHEVGFLAVADGHLRVGDACVESGELVQLEPGADPIKVDGAGMDGTTFVLGSAVPHPHGLVLGRYSVHTSPQALACGEANIARLGKRLHASSLAAKGGQTPVYR